MSPFIKRLVSATLLFTFLISTYLLFTFEVTILLISAMVAWEVFYFSTAKQDFPLSFKVLLVITFCFVSGTQIWNFYQPKELLSLLPWIGVLLFWALGILLLCSNTQSSWGKDKAQAKLAQINSTLCFSTVFLIYALQAPFLALNILKADPQAIWLWSLAVICITTDSFAYFTGRLWGRRQIDKLTLLSPKKTLEGIVGGTLAGFITALILMTYLLERDLEVTDFALAFALPLTAQTGDFLASFWKRCFNCKNSSNLIPGHGGFFDRFDSIYFCIPLWYLIFLFR